MGLLAFLNLEGTDAGAFVVSGLIGYFAGTLAPPGTWAIFITLMVAYHLFLAWLVFGSRYNTAAPPSMVAVLVTHACCLGLVIVPVVIANGVVPFFDVVRYALVGLALFERSWLFSGSELRKQSESKAGVEPRPVTQLTPKQLNPKQRVAQRPGMAARTVVKPVELPLPSAKVGRAFDAWQRHLERQRPGTREYELWMRARRRQQTSAH